MNQRTDQLIAGMAELAKGVDAAAEALRATADGSTPSDIKDAQARYAAARQALRQGQEHATGAKQAAAQFAALI